MNYSWQGTLGCDAANISVMDLARTCNLRSGFSGHQIADMGKAGFYLVSLEVSDTWCGDAVESKEIYTSSGKFYIGDWCYAIDLNEEPPNENDLDILVVNTGGDGAFDVSVHIKRR